MRRHLMVGLVAVVGACLVGWAANTQGQARVTWEYYEIGLPATASAVPRLNQFGADGWELVGVISACPSNPNYAADCKYYAYFKRPK